MTIYFTSKATSWTLIHNHTRSKNNVSLSKDYAQRLGYDWKTCKTLPLTYNGSSKREPPWINVLLKCQTSEMKSLTNIEALRWGVMRPLKTNRGLAERTKEELAEASLGKSCKLPPYFLFLGLVAVCAQNIHYPQLNHVFGTLSITVPEDSGIPISSEGIQGCCNFKMICWRWRPSRTFLGKSFSGSLE